MIYREITWRVYRLTGGPQTGLIFAPCSHKAVSTFCQLHDLFPAQVAVIYSYPLHALF